MYLQLILKSRNPLPSFDLLPNLQGNFGTTRIPKVQKMEYDPKTKRSVQDRQLKLTPNMEVRLLRYILIDISKSSQIGAQAAITLLKENMPTIVNTSKQDTMQKPQINSITKFLEKNNSPILIQPPRLIRAKGCGRVAKPPKSCTRFESLREQAVDRIISTRIESVVDVEKLDTRFEDAPQQMQPLMILILQFW